MSGPQRARLDRALAGAHEDAVTSSAREWVRCVGILHDIAAALDGASPEVRREIGGRTGPAIDAAFQRSSQGMVRRADDLVQGSTALQAAAEAIGAARAEQEQLRQQPLTAPAPYVAGPGPRTDEDIAREAAARQAQRDYDLAYADQEARAQARADHLDRVFAASTATMKDIHKVPDPEPSGSGSGTSGGSGAGSGGAVPHPVPAGGGSGPRGDGASPTRPPGGSGDGSGHHHPGTHGTHSVPPPPAPGDVGVPQGGSAVGVPGPTPVGALGGAVPVGGPGGLGLGLAGAAAGGLGGGLLGTGLAAGGIRGGVAGPIVTAPGTAAGGVRGIGATSRAGVTGALGRPGGVAAAGSGPGSTGRGTAVRSSGVASGRGTGRGAGGRGAAGARGSGGRGTGAAAGARSGRKQDDRPGGRDPFDTVAEDWIDDEEVAPGVLD